MNGVAESAPPPIAPGVIVAGKYRVGRVVGRGAMGYVASATHLQLGQQVAIKFLSESDEDNSARFQREAQAPLSLQSEHIVRVFDFGTHAERTPYIVMELLEGIDLAAVVAADGPLPIDTAVDYVLQSCAGVGEAHARGIVHRDLKPSNLFLTRRANGTPLIKVLDFGISKFTDHAGLALDLTATRSAIGSPAYMSPEQVRNSKDVDTRTDIWSLGVVLYNLLTERSPFQGDTPASMCAAIVADAAQPVRAFRPDVPVGLESVISRCMEKERGLRVPDVGELATLLLPYASRAGRMVGRHVAQLDSVGKLDTQPPRRFLTGPPAPVPEQAMTASAAGLRDDGPTHPASLLATSTIEDTVSASAAARAAEPKKRGLGIVALALVAAAASFLVTVFVIRGRASGDPSRPSSAAVAAPSENADQPEDPGPSPSPTLDPGPTPSGAVSAGARPKRHRPGAPRRAPAAPSASGYARDRNNVPIID